MQLRVLLENMLDWSTYIDLLLCFNLCAAVLYIAVQSLFSKNKSNQRFATNAIKKNIMMLCLPVNTFYVMSQFVNIIFRISSLSKTILL